MACSTPSSASAAERRRRGWLDRSVLVVCLASLALTLVAAVVQVSNGAVSMTFPEAWAALFDPDIAHLETRDVVGDLTAVRNGDVSRGGPHYQGPIFTLV